MTSKLTNGQRNSKTYWPLLNRFLNNQKMPLTRPLFHEYKFVTNFKKKNNKTKQNKTKVEFSMHFLQNNSL